MSRSLGDTIGRKVGVIPNPICIRHTLNLRTDKFIVIASDGIWDVMDNQDVVNFVEYHRGKTLRTPLHSQEGLVGIKNATIA